MSSILKVDTLQTAAGGVPTAADLGLNVTGTVLQVVSFTVANGGATTSSSATDLATLGSITTTMPNSKIVVSSTMPTQLSSNSDGQAVFGLRHSVNSYTTELERHVVARNREATNGWLQTSQNFFALHNPLVTSGTTITYKIYGKRTNGTSDIYVGDAWGQSPYWSCVLMEIAG